MTSLHPFALRPFAQQVLKVGLVTTTLTFRSDAYPTDRVAKPATSSAVSDRNERNKEEVHLIPSPDLSRGTEHLTHPPPLDTGVLARCKKPIRFALRSRLLLAASRRASRPLGSVDCALGGPYAAPQEQELSKDCFPAGPRPSRRPLRRRGLLRANRISDTLSLSWGDI